MDSTPSLQIALQVTQANQSIASQFLSGQTKSYGLLEIGTTPELTNNRVSAFNLSSFLSNSPENLTLDLKKKKRFRSFLAFPQESSWDNGKTCLNELSNE